MKKDNLPPMIRNPREQFLDTWEMIDLCNAFANLKNQLEVKQFLRDICTLAELQEMGRRWQIALLLKKGKSYLAIAKETGASTATVTRVASWIHHGMGGYKLMLKRIGSIKDAGFHRLRAIPKKS